MNLLEILKQCPKGMELDCVMYDNAYLEQVNEKAVYPIVIRIGKTDTICLTKEGHWNKFPNAKCVIFPKGKTTWNDFKVPFKTGDFIYGRFNNTVGILVKINGGSYKVCDVAPNGGFYYKGPVPIVDSDYRLASDNEARRLTDVMHYHGVVWSQELKRIVPIEKSIFKVGDKIESLNGDVKLVIKEVTPLYYIDTDGWKFLISDQNNWKLIHKKFDISTLKPFDKVLARPSNSDLWECELFSSYNANCSNPFHCLGIWTEQCIPYEGNEHLLGTTNDCDEFYKTWI